jgi:DNA-binding transcriptional LysR family regulator
MWVDLITAFTSEHLQHTLSCSTVSIPQLAEEGFSPHCSFLLAFENDIPAAYTEELDSIFLFETKPTVMLHKDHPLAQEPVLTLPMLAEERMFMPMPDFSLCNRLTQLFELHELPFPGENAYTLSARLKLVAGNMGISFFTNFAGYIPRPDIRYIPLEDPFDPWVARLYWRKDRPLSEYETVFRDFTQKFYQELH